MENEGKRGEAMKQRKWLSELRKAQRLSQQQVADKSGMTRSMVSSLETGEKDPSVSTAKSIADVLGFQWTIFFENK